MISALEGVALAASVVAAEAALAVSVAEVLEEVELAVAGDFHSVILFFKSVD